MIQSEPDQPQCRNMSDLLDFDKVEEYMTPLVDKMLAMKPFPTGLFVPLDIFAAILYHLLNKRGVRPGYDVEVVSANNERPYLAGLYPRPTSIDIGGSHIGQSAVDQLMLRIQNPEDARGMRMIVEPIVIEGERIEKK